MVASRNNSHIELCGAGPLETPPFSMVLFCEQRAAKQRRLHCACCTMLPNRVIRTNVCCLLPSLASVSRTRAKKGATPTPLPLLFHRRREFSTMRIVQPNVVIHEQLFDTLTTRSHSVPCPLPSPPSSKIAISHVNPLMNRMNLLELNGFSNPLTPFQKQNTTVKFPRATGKSADEKGNKILGRLSEGSDRADGRGTVQGFAGNHR